MKLWTDEFAASWGVSVVGIVLWTLLLPYLSTRHLQPLL